MESPSHAIDYAAAERAIIELLDQPGTAEEKLDRIVAALATCAPHYSWVGIYLLVGETLVLGPWRGPAATEHTRIPIGQGVCGAAARSRRTEVVDDVSQDPRYLACFLSTKSEIVVPIQDAAGVYGEIDIDSDQLAAFTPTDQAFLERIARHIVAETRAAAAQLRADPAPRPS